MGDSYTKNDDFFMLDNTECIILKIKNSIHKIFADSPLTVKDFLILKMIHESEKNGGHITASDLSRSFHVSRSAISQFTVSLERRGYITGKNDKNDKRKTYLSVTERAKKLLDSFKQKFIETINGIRDKLGSEKFNALITLSSEAADLLEKSTYKTQKI